MPPVLRVKSFGKKREDNKSRKDRCRRKWSDVGHFLPCFGAKTPYLMGFLSYTKTPVLRTFCLKIPRWRHRIGSNPITRTTQKGRISALFAWRGIRGFENSFKSARSRRRSSEHAFERLPFRRQSSRAMRRDHSRHAKRAQRRPFCMAWDKRI